MYVQKHNKSNFRSNHRLKNIKSVIKIIVHFYLCMSISVFIFVHCFTKRKTMGYYTRHKLEIVEGDDNLTDYAEQISKISDYADCFDDEIKWYEREENMIEFSKQHPQTLFKIIGEGEEPGDLWHEYYLNGKVQKCKGEITYTPFDPSKLQ